MSARILDQKVAIIEYIMYTDTREGIVLHSAQWSIWNTCFLSWKCLWLLPMKLVLKQHHGAKLSSAWTPVEKESCLGNSKAQLVPGMPHFPLLMGKFSYQWKSLLFEEKEIRKGSILVYKILWEKKYLLLGKVHRKYKKLIWELVYLKEIMWTSFFPCGRNLSCSHKRASEIFPNAAFCILCFITCGNEHVHYLAQMHKCIWSREFSSLHWLNEKCIVFGVHKENSHWTPTIKVIWGHYHCHLMYFPQAWMRKTDWWYLALQSFTCSSIGN